MKKILRKTILFLSSLFGGRYAGKMIGMFDFCRDVICSNQKVFAGQIHNRMDINNVIPSVEIKEKASHTILPTDKIKVRIVYPAGDSWNNIHTLYESFAADDRFQTYVVVKNEARFISIMESVGCHYVTYNNYSIKEDRPDIFISCFYAGLERDIVFPGCRKYIGKVYLFIPSAVMNEETRDIHWDYIKRANIYTEPDYIIADPLVYNSLEGYVEDSKRIVMGGCQFDEIFREVGKKHPVPESWGKLKGKTTFLWATDHGINESYPKNGFTVDLYLQPMLKFFAEHLEYGLIFRPHPQLIREMWNSRKFWTADDVNKLKLYIESTPNIIWDDTFDFCCAYDVCSGLIVDANCSITLSFLTTGKPICRLLRYDMKEWLVSPELHDCYYYANNFEECKNFMDMVASGEDSKKEAREKGFKYAILNFDGLNGRRMKDFIASDYLKAY